MQTVPFPYMTYSTFLNTLSNFSSLHNRIEQETDYLEQNDNLFEYNDPDNHFISNDFLRTILTPDCEIRVGNRLYLLRNGFTMAVTNNDLDARRNILEIIRSSSDSNDGLYDLCNQNENINDGNSVEATGIVLHNIQQ